MNWKEESGEILKYVGGEVQCMRIFDFPNMSGVLCDVHTLLFGVSPSAISVTVSRMLSQDTPPFTIQWNMKQLKVGHYMLDERFHVYILPLCHKVSEQLTNSCQVFFTVLYIMHCMYLLRCNFTWVNIQQLGTVCLTKIVAALEWHVILVATPVVPQHFNHFCYWFLWTLSCRRYCDFGEWNSRPKFISLFEFPISGNCIGSYRTLMLRTHLIIR